MSSTDKCGVCQKHQDLKSLPGGVIFENDALFIAHFPLLENQPNPYFGHIIIELKRHITRPSELNENEAKYLGIWIQKISAALENILNAEHVYIFRIGDKTPHLHFHIVPRYANTPKEVWGTGIYEWPMARRAQTRELIEISDGLRKFLCH
ncbi:MAG: HIT domain-containing protein [Oligoflexia bacterium]|nr:HIT domain-containing protein [Oligoflexia bacterium]